MKVYINCHKDIHDNPRGGEISVRIIAEYLAEYYDVQYGDYRFVHNLPEADVYLTWGNAAKATHTHCRHNKKPYILMVRFWRNVSPLPVGDLMTTEIPYDFKFTKQALFDHASAVITNNDYSCAVLKKHYGVKAITSYVPVLGDIVHNKPGDYLTIINPEIYGEYTIASSLTDHKLLIANCNDARFKRLTNCDTWGHRPSEQIYSHTRILLLPTYHNDICGTRRISIEAMRYGIPVIANDRCGIGEWVPNLVSRDAMPQEWDQWISDINDNYAFYRKQAQHTFLKYDTKRQLKIFKDAIEDAVS